MIAISGGASTAPTAVPALMMPMAVARSFVGNHSATATGGGREASAFAHAEEKPAHGQHRESGSERVAGTGKRPEHHNHGKATPRSQKVHKFSAAGIHQGVGKQKRGLQRGELFIGERECLC